MSIHVLRPNNLSQKMMRVIFSIYIVVACLITSVQFLTEYLKTQDSILNELKQLEETVRGSISASFWQYDYNQMEVLISGLIKMPIIEGVDILDKNGNEIIAKRSYNPSSPPLSMFSTESKLDWKLKDKDISLGSLTLYSSSQIVLDRVLFGFTLIAITAIVKLSILFWLFIWAFDRYLSRPLKELVSQVDEIQLNQNMSKRIHLSAPEDNEIGQLQKHMNIMLSAIESDREKLLQDEKSKRNWLETAVEKRTEELLLLNKKLQYLATRDSLTGILNRGSFFETAQHLLALSKRQNSTATLVVMDLDKFKLINDNFGHFIGDKVLVHFAQTIQTFLRKSDLIGRLGGEEFAIFLPDTDINAAFQIADKIREAVSCSRLEVDGKTVTYTVSLGIDSSLQTDNLIEELFKRADLKLYGAKDKGRNRVER